MRFAANRFISVSAVQSPCVNVCSIGPDGLCEGCARTLNEIASWRTMSEREQVQLLAVLPARRRPLGKATTGSLGPAILHD